MIYTQDRGLGFSILISIYHKEAPEFFNQAMESLWDEQTLKPSEIILVEDGKLTAGLYEQITIWKKKLNGILKRVPLETNQGLGKALNIGLEHCQYEYVARMDTDDICTPDRFEKQITFLKNNPNIGIVGGQIKEFEREIGDLSVSRKLPTSYEELLAFSKKRCPFNHPTVIYKKSVVQQAGNYQDDHLYEDYALWARIINQETKVANLPDVVLHMRAGDAMVQRRGGLKYALSETKAQFNFYKMGFLSIPELLRNLVFRFPVRLVPNQIRVLFYKVFLRD